MPPTAIDKIHSGMKYEEKKKKKRKYIPAQDKRKAGHKGNTHNRVTKDIQYSQHNKYPRYTMSIRPDTFKAYFHLQTTHRKV